MKINSVHYGINYTSFFLYIKIFIYYYYYYYCSEEGLHLPPISVIDDFLPTRSWQPQQLQPAQPSPWLPLSHSSPFQPVITPSSTSISSSPPSTTTSSSTPVARSSYSPPAHHDIDQVCICILMHCTRADKKKARPDLLPSVVPLIVVKCLFWYF